MPAEPPPVAGEIPGVVLALGEQPMFRVGEALRILTRSPVGHYRVPSYLRGKRGRVETVIEPAGLDNEQEGFGLNAGIKRHYYRLAIAMPEIWPTYSGSPQDSLRIEIYETWLEKGRAMSVHRPDHDHGHDHSHDAITVLGEAGYYEIMEAALRELLVEKRQIGADEVRRQIEAFDSRTPALGARVVARAWVDPAFKAVLLANGRAACESMGVSFYDDTQLIVLENTERVHNLIVCTLCSCYPRPLLGLPPEWYKLKPYRARAVIEPRAVLAEFGTIIPEDVEVRVSDSTAMVRYLVLPQQPHGTEGWSEEELAALVTRDAMIGVIPITLPRETSAP